MNRHVFSLIGLLVFSNDTYGTFGPKSFDNWLFEIKENRKIVLKTKY